MLGVIAASVMFGAAVSASPRETSALTLALLDSLNAAIEVAVGWAISLMPPGVLSLVAGRVAGSCDPIGTLAALGKYVFAVSLGLGIHGGAVLPAMYALATRNWSGRMMLGRGTETPGWRAVLPKVSRVHHRVRHRFVVRDAADDAAVRDRYAPGSADFAPPSEPPRT